LGSGLAYRMIKMLHAFCKHEFGGALIVATIPICTMLLHSYKQKKNTNRKTKLFVCCLAISTHIVELNLDGLSLTNCLLLEEIKQKRSHTLWLIIIPGHFYAFV